MNFKNLTLMKARIIKSLSAFAYIFISVITASLLVGCSDELTNKPVADCLIKSISVNGGTPIMLAYNDQNLLTYFAGSRYYYNSNGEIASKTSQGYQPPCLKIVTSFEHSPGKVIAIRKMDISKCSPYTIIECCWEGVTHYYFKEGKISYILRSGEPDGPIGDSTVFDYINENISTVRNYYFVDGKAVLNYKDEIEYDDYPNPFAVFRGGYDLLRERYLIPHYTNFSKNNPLKVTREYFTPPNAGSIEIDTYTYTYGKHGYPEVIDALYLGYDQVQYVVEYDCIN